MNNYCLVIDLNNDLFCYNQKNICTYINIILFSIHNDIFKIFSLILIYLIMYNIIVLYFSINL